jgi:putative ABC transport system ATP-binding protein
VKTLFELEHVTLSRADRTVLTDVSATLPVGACALVGPSGCGKSSLLRLLNRLADPERGEIRYRGRPVVQYDVLGLRREIGLVPQLPALGRGTVADNVAFAARLGDCDPSPARLLELAGLDPGFLERDAAQLSVGEQQRVMLARALALEPSVLLLDEPTSALDTETREAVERTLVRLRAELGISIVLVTHDLSQAARVSDWVLRLDRGRAEQGGRLVPV